MGRNLKTLSHMNLAIRGKLGTDATKKLPSGGFKREWPLPIKMDESVKAKVGKLFNS